MTITLPSLGHVTNTYVFISIYAKSVTTKLGRMVSFHWLYLTSDNKVSITKYRDQCLWFYLHFQQSDNNQTWYGTSVWTVFIFQMIMLSSQIDHVRNINGFTSSSISPIATKVESMLASSLWWYLCLKVTGYLFMALLTLL